MQIIADLHIHSRFSRAVSQRMNLIEIDNWAKKKGVKVVATGDWTHPLWFREIQSTLIESSPGLYSIKNGDSKTKFILATEISSIYSQGGKTRRIHNVVFAPSINIAEKISQKLQSQGAKLMSDGRPIIGLSARELLELILSVDQQAFLIPAHIWTPWFSLFGSKSGFDTIIECFGDYAKYIYGIETGLSSDPLMNWQIKELENRSIISSSDAHSCQKLGREATVFIAQNSNLKTQNLNFSYIDIFEAIQQKPNAKLKIGYTIEFFPEEGKYHWSGHRSCNIRYNAKEVIEKGIFCPVCKQPLTIGVENRVIKLAEKILQPSDIIMMSNKAGLTFVYDKDKKRRPFVSTVPLSEVLLEVNNNSPTKALAQYEKLIPAFANEFEILLSRPYSDIEKYAGVKLAQAIKILRERKVFVDPGYDGVFGKVKVFNDNVETTIEQIPAVEKQPSLF